MRRPRPAIDNTERRSLSDDRPISAKRPPPPVRVLILPVRPKAPVLQSIVDGSDSFKSTAVAVQSSVLGVEPLRPAGHSLHEDLRLTWWHWKTRSRFWQNWKPVERNRMSSGRICSVMAKRTWCIATRCTVFEQCDIFSQWSKV